MVLRSLPGRYRVSKMSGNVHAIRPVEVAFWRDVISWNKSEIRELRPNRKRK